MSIETLTVSQIENIGLGMNIIDCFIRLGLQESNEISEIISLVQKYTPHEYESDRQKEAFQSLMHMLVCLRDEAKE